MLEQSALIVQMLSIVHEHLLRIPEGKVVRLPVHPAGAVLSLADQAGVHLRQLSQCPKIALFHSRNEGTKILPLINLSFICNTRFQGVSGNDFINSIDK